MSVKIKYVLGETIAFTINTDLYYLKTGPDYPQLFNSDLVLQIVPNIDVWLQANTQQRYSFRSICDMAEAFRCGLETAYTKQDMRIYAEMAIQAARDLLFQSERVSDYARLFWIEVMDPTRLEGSYARVLRENFDKIRTKLGDDRLYNHLCRMWRLCNFRRPSEAAVFERLIRRLGKLPQESRYPVTAELDGALKHDALLKIWGRRLPQYKTVSDAIIEKVQALQGSVHPNVVNENG